MKQRLFAFLFAFMAVSQARSEFQQVDLSIFGMD